MQNAMCSDPSVTVPSSRGAFPPVKVEICRNADYLSLLKHQREEFKIRTECRKYHQSKLSDNPNDSCSSDRMPDDLLIIAEHTPVYTIGKHGNKENLLIPMDTLRLWGAECIEIERGGDITYHGTGQITAYPIIDMLRYRLGVKQYVNLLEECVILTLAHFGLSGERVEGATGVWLDKGKPDERKICAIGVKCSRFVTMHGLALNVSTDLKWFSNINPCGFIDKGVTNMMIELGEDPGWERVAAVLQDKMLGLLRGRLSFPL